MLSKGDTRCILIIYPAVSINLVHSQTLLTRSSWPGLSFVGLSSVRINVFVFMTPQVCVPQAVLLFVR